MNAIQEVNERRVLNHKDISEIYGVGTSVAYRIIRETRAKYPNGKHPLPAGKIFKSDLAEYFENQKGGMS